MLAACLLTGALLTACGGDSSTGSNDQDSETVAEAQATSPLFTLLPANETGIHFENQLAEDVNTDQNVLSYQYFFNGAGVAIGDVNNDGLEDVFFTGNSQPNRLYINKGNLKFEDVTDKANIGQNRWSTGATMVDINGDGHLDIYVCNAGGTRVPAERENWLYVNQGDGTFKESARAFGLNDHNRSTQASFFDYDKDGDLDVFVMNHANYFRIPLRTVLEDLEKPGKLELASSNLYRNDNGKFTKVSKEAGVLRYGYGLGLVTVDINNDGLTDIYQANDYSVPDFMYINNGDGTFTEDLKRHTRQVAWFGMGADIADFNNDGHVDIGVVDMAAADHVRGKTLMLSMDSKAFWTYIEYLGYQYQYMFNALQLNNGDGSFSNIPHMAGIAATDWSWTSLFCDLDNDGFKDYIVTNGYRRYALDNDFRNEMKRLRDANGGAVPAELRAEMYEKMPQIPLPNTIYRNKGDLTFDMVSQDWGLGHKSFSNGAAVADLDQDGDLDFIVNNIDATAFVYRNNSTEKNGNNWLRVKVNTEGPEANGLNSKVLLKYQGATQFQEIMPVRGYESSHGSILHFGLGGTANVDSVIVTFPYGGSAVLTNVAANQLLEVNEAEVKGAPYQPTKSKPLFARLDPAKMGLNFKHTENKYDDFTNEILLPHRQSVLGPFLGLGDVNGDGLEDVYVGGALGQTGQLFVQKNGQFAALQGPWNKDKGFEDMGSHFFDADGDGDKDLYVVSGGTALGPDSPALQDRLYINNGGSWGRSTGLPTMLTSGQHVSSSDIDGDGDLDLFVGGRVVPGKYPYTPLSYLLENDGAGNFKDVTARRAPELQSIGMINDVVWTDLDGDSDDDMVLAGEWTAIEMLRNDGGNFSRITEESGLAQLKGWWYSLTEADVDGDGDLDLIAGNVGQNNKFHPSLEKPLHVYSDDLDNSGSCDIVLSKYYKGNLVPVRGRECSSEQMPFITEKFPTYTDFAHAKLDEIYTPQKLDAALHLEATEFRSMLLVNDGSGKYTASPLPSRAQIAPVNGAVVLNANNDGIPDLLVAGNMYGAEVETPRYDAGVGLLLRGTGNADFTPLAPYQSGFSVPYDVKDVKALYMGPQLGTVVLLAVNNQSLVVYRVLGSEGNKKVLLSTK